MSDLPLTLQREIDELVAAGAFPDARVALAELVRLGLDAFRGKRPPSPSRPPVPPGVGHVPGEDDRPIAVDPSDPKWIR